MTQELEICPYNLRPRVKKEAESRSSREEMHDQEGPVRSRGSRFQEPRPYNKDPSYKQQSRRQSPQEKEQEPRSEQLSRQNPQRGLQERQEMTGKSTSRRTASLEVLLGDVKYKRKY
ncbi:hypothetical protein TNIN_100671 [Trichonephila inaurata madagascariensis]|uniref:Uncharacterized protein n=1 Tax=Trichonephila inaurata madagascariensis TaxID=2747483 RepID=A0A8X6JTJ9_9ARAC|nr:hypothetical protein TNIN_100671 [Trichonephila inaurata madagascariensis]